MSGAPGDLNRELEAARTKRLKDAAPKPQRFRRKGNGDVLTETCEICMESCSKKNMGSCTGDVTHTHCHACIKKQIDTIIGQNRYKPACMVSPRCKGVYRPATLVEIIDENVLKRMERLEAEDAVRKAGIKDMTECPVCGFRVSYPPIAKEPNFHCQNPECEKVTCRKCKLAAHAGNCKDHQKGKKVDIRHLVEEAMTEAILRTCAHCQSKFMKDEGCNKMQCPSCQNTQCYVCGKSGISYDHFGNTRCKLFENTEERHNEEVKQAVEKATAKMKAEHPEITDEDLKIEMSARVKEDDQRRLRRADAEARGNLWHPGMPIEGDEFDRHIPPFRQFPPVANRHRRFDPRFDRFR
ncbi:hypothetical protein EJ06DRAFT_555874 [Trichodelitschia bisporula]|uniref:RING-type domain-containing protein n=1 Tax=Trichodelitschia bisporula TaxID=703511 RepID=A0A6G1HZ46_9PEZI|nr:hypothetical protein EJ06DRAFT_555874 [Trichodelitschia bisporula]